jgi:ornithine cyclodeaminase
MSLHYLSEATIRNAVTQERVSEAIEAMYRAIARGEAWSFPTVRENLDHLGAVFGFKSGFEAGRRLLGVKAGGLWPGNRGRNLENHQSTVLLFDPDCGEPRALVRANYLTALRTAAASSISIRHLARRDATTLGIVGAGGQAEYQLRSAMTERPFERVLVADLDADRAAGLASRLWDLGADVRACEARELVEQSAVVISITPSTSPVIMRSWVRPGTHIACMGADTKGKQEIETALAEGAELFVDDVEQSITIGEFQHAFGEQRIERDGLTFIGDVIAGKSPGRSDDDQVTIFDSSGIGLQDLVAAQLALAIVGDCGNLDDPGHR